MKIKKTFEKLEISGKKALIPFVTAGDPNYDLSLEILKVISKSGADIIELGMPFSDPMADGPSIHYYQKNYLIYLLQIIYDGNHMNYIHMSF